MKYAFIDMVTNKSVLTDILVDLFDSLQWPIEPSVVRPNLVGTRVEGFNGTVSLNPWGASIILEVAAGSTTLSLRAVFDVVNGSIESEVNWPSIGATTPDNAERFAMSMMAWSHRLRNAAALLEPLCKMDIETYKSSIQSQFVVGR